MKTPEKRCWLCVKIKRTPLDFDVLKRNSSFYFQLTDIFLNEQIHQFMWGRTDYTECGHLGTDQILSTTRNTSLYTGNTDTAEGAVK